MKNFNSNDLFENTTDSVSKTIDFLNQYHEKVKEKINLTKVHIFYFKQNDVIRLYSEERGEGGKTKYVCTYSTLKNEIGREFAPSFMRNGLYKPYTWKNMPSTLTMLGSLIK